MKRNWKKLENKRENTGISMESLKRNKQLQTSTIEFHSRIINVQNEKIIEKLS